MPTTSLFDTAQDREYFRIRPWIETATRQMICTADDCGNTIDPGEEIVRDDDRGGMHVDCAIAQALDRGEQ